MPWANERVWEQGGAKQLMPACGIKVKNQGALVTVWVAVFRRTVFNNQPCGKPEELLLRVGGARSKVGGVAGQGVGGLAFAVF